MEDPNIIVTLIVCVNGKEISLECTNWEWGGNGIEVTKNDVVIANFPTYDYWRRG